MIITVPDAVGTLGVIVVLLGYYLLQSDTLRYDDYTYLALNGVGSALILVSLAYKFNPASFMIELCWVAISLYGVLRRWRRDRQAPRP